MAEFGPTLNYTDEQRSGAPNLDRSFEHLLRSSSVHESIITTLRVNEITDRDTLVNMFDSELGSEHLGRTIEAKCFSAIAFGGYAREWGDWSFAFKRTVRSCS